MCVFVCERKKERKRESVFDWREWESTKEALCTVTALRYKRDIICPEKNGWTRHSSTLWRPPMAKTRCPISRSTPSGRAKREIENAWEKERENRSGVRAACFKLAVLYSANFSFERHNGEWRRDGPFGERCKSASHGDTRLTSAWLKARENIVFGGYENGKKSRKRFFVVVVR